MRLVGGLRSPLLRQSSGASTFDPVSLFSSGEKGMIYDPTNIATLWQDSARTTPVTTSGEPIGAIDDLSPNGWHMLQTTSTSRPLYEDASSIKSFVSDATDDWLNCAAAASVFQNKTFGTEIMAANPNSAATFMGLLTISHGANGAASRLALGKSSTNTTRSSCRRIDSDTQQQITSTYGCAGAWSVFLSEMDWALGQLHNAQNLSARQTTDVSGAIGTGATSNTPSLTPCNYFGGLTGFQGAGAKCGRTIVIDRELTSIERTDAIKWCGAGAGLSL